MVGDAATPNGELRMVSLEAIRVPSIRITAQYDADLQEELVESVAQQGILQPLQVEESNGELWLVDGYNRLVAARTLGIEEVPCYVKPGDQEGILVKNLITSRQKGKSNPAEEAKVVRYLLQQGGMPLEKVAGLTGMSLGWTRKLYDVSWLPATILDLVAQGKLGISHALELLPLKDAALQLEVAGQAVEWHYTIEQVRMRVRVLNEPALASQPGGITFDTQGHPSRVPIPCYVCHVDLTGNVSYIYLCGECQELINEMLRAYQERLVGPATESAPSPPVAQAYSEPRPH